MKPRLPREVVHKTRELRRETTQAEKRLWGSIQNRQMCGIKFRRQHPIGLYVVDFYSHETKLVIEIVGGHHGEEVQLLHDIERTAELERLGLLVLRFRNSQVLSDIEGVLERIRQVCRAS